MRRAWRPIQALLRRTSLAADYLDVHVLCVVSRENVEQLDTVRAIGCILKISLVAVRLHFGQLADFIGYDGEPAPMLAARALPRLRH